MSLCVKVAKLSYLLCNNPSEILLNALPCVRGGAEHCKCEAEGLLQSTNITKKESLPALFFI